MVSLLANLDCLNKLKIIEWDKNGDVIAIPKSIPHV